jgi:bis(5'-nucleosyl)-tetraphosphatase (symmetrical)
MSTYAIGDIQGCHRSLTALLDAIAFRPEEDRLRLVGDLVNRGPESLEVLRWAKGLGEPHVSVLGNHDLHLLARGWGRASAKRLDTLDAILEAPDRGDLLEWLRHRPLLHREGPFLVVHAGLHPAWGVEEAEALARETEAVLRGPRGADLVGSLYPLEDAIDWDPGRTGLERARTVLAILTRIRVVTPGGRVLLDEKGPPEASAAEAVPWFEAPNPRDPGTTVIFGHWSALGLAERPGAVGLDTGCVWGGSLTALRLEDRHVVSVPAADRSV